GGAGRRVIETRRPSEPRAHADSLLAPLDPVDPRDSGRVPWGGVGKGSPAESRVVEEWRLRQIGALRLEHPHRWPDGSETVVHGDDPRCCALTLRTHPGPAVSVVAIGPIEEVETFSRRWPAPGVELARAFPP